MTKRLLYRREDRAMLKRLFTWLECLAVLIGAIALGLFLFA
ncbi:hypothetical protein [Microbulbifer sp. 2201CG32-9]